MKSVLFWKKRKTTYQVFSPFFISIFLIPVLFKKILFVTFDKSVIFLNYYLIIKVKKWFSILKHKFNQKNTLFNL